MSMTRIRIGYIPLVDAAALVVAADFGFAAAENLALDLVREVSWSNVRDKLNIGLFDAAHLLSPVAIASNLGVGHVRVPIIAPFNLGLNGNAITVSPRLFAAMSNLADGEMGDGWRPSASIPMRMSGWSCCHRPTWLKVSRTNTSMDSVSVRHGIRWRWSRVSA
jgi:hypothetical protein